MSLLGQIVAGESATPQGQQAVLNVIQNRAAINFGGYGNTLDAQATAYRQFSAYPNALGVPSANTEAMVSAAQGGTLPNIVPNSLNYANPSIVTNPNSWVWGAQQSGQGVLIGGNTFWANDRGGSPGYDPSQAYNGGQGGVAQGPPNQSSSFPTGDSYTGSGTGVGTFGGTNPADPYGTGGGFTETSPGSGFATVTDAPASGGIGGSFDPSSPNYISTPSPTIGTATTGTGTIGGSFLGTNPLNPFGGGGTAPGTIGGSFLGTNPLSTVPGLGGQLQPGQGSPVNVGLQQQTVSDIQNWVNSLATRTGQAFTTVMSNVFGGIANWFTRGFLIILAILIIVIALAAMMFDRKDMIAVVRGAAKAV